MRRMSRYQRSEPAAVMRWWGLELGPMSTHQRTSADEARHQSSRSTKGTETAKRWRQCAEYAAATARDEIRLRSSEFSPAARVQLYEPWSVTPPSMTIVLAGRRKPRSLVNPHRHIGLGQRLDPARAPARRRPIGDHPNINAALLRPDQRPDDS